MMTKRRARHWLRWQSWLLLVGQLWWLAGLLLTAPAPVLAVSDSYQGILDALSVETGTVTLPGANAEGFTGPTRWTVTVNDPGMAELERLRRRYQEMVQLRYVDWDDPAVQERVARLERDLVWRVNQQNAQTGEISGGLQTVRQLAFAYHVPGSRWYQDTQMIRNVIEPALRYEITYNNLHPDNGLPGNWWTWEVQVPFRLLDILFAVGEELSPDVRDDLEDMLLWCNLWIGRDSSSLTKASPSGDLFYLTEANGAWFRVVSLLTGLYFRLPPVVQWAANEMNWGLRTNEGLAAGTRSAGPKPDYTPWDHGRAPNQLYGDHLFETAAFYVYLTHDSPLYGPTSEAVTYLGNYFHEWLRWNFYQGLEQPATRGRWPHMTEAGELFMGAVFLLNLPDPPYADELARVVVEWLAKHPDDLEMEQGYWGIATPWFGNFHLPGDTLLGQPALAQAVARAQTPAPPPTGARYYPWSEFLVVRRSSWYAGLAMRTANVAPRALAREHDGGLVFFTDGNVTDFVDLELQEAQHLYDGITAVTGEVYNGPNAWRREESPMAGAATLGDFAAAGMALQVLVDDDRRLWAHKSCFAFDEEIVCLGSDIRSDDPRPVRTYLHTLPAARTLEGGSNWLYDGTLGVVVADGATWKQETVTYNDRDWVQTFVEHGVQPSGATYRFAYLPMTSRSRTQSYAQAPDFEVLVQTVAAHGVRDRSSQATGVVFFEATDQAAGHAASGPAHLLYIAQGDRVHSLALYNPSPTTTTLTITLPLAPMPILVSRMRAHPWVTSVQAGADSLTFTAEVPRFGSLAWLQRPPDLSKSYKIVSRPDARVGETVTYTVVVRNSGDPFTETVRLTDTLPSGLQLVAGSCQLRADGADALEAPACAGSRITWEGVLSSSTVLTLTYRARVDEGRPAVLRNTVVVESSPVGVLSRSATMIVNAYRIVLPLILKQSLIANGRGLYS